MFLKQITAVILFAITGTALAGGKTPPVCTIFINLPTHDNILPWTSTWVIAAAICLIVVLAARLHRNRSHI